MIEVIQICELHCKNSSGIVELNVETVMNIYHFQGVIIKLLGTILGES